MTQLKPKFQHVVITGASSGIGAALALGYAAQGVHLSLSGRDTGRLEEIADQCRFKGATVAEKIIDVTDRPAMHQWLEEIDTARPVDVVIANAGISAGMGGGNSETAEQVRKLFDTNVNGVLNTIDPLLPRMAARRAGHIALMSSLAAFRGWPGAPAYCATKAAVRSYGEGLRGALSRSGIKVHVICPGFVKSRMTAVNTFPMPFLMETDKAAQIIITGIQKNRGRIAFPFIAYSAVWLVNALPDAIGGRLLRLMPAKGAEKA